jgi:tetratricopeptide (TPR) repeat protein/transcriptional regulator with XRE-family HTH domain
MATVQPLSFGNLLLRYRSAAGLTQEALAERAHLSARAISDLERGVKHTPRHDTVRLLADALQLSAEERATFTAAARRHAALSRTRDVGPHLTSAVAQPPFVGRTRELALLARHLQGAGPPVLVLAGEPGIGKSRLLHEATQRADRYGLCVLQGGCQRRGGQEPYAPLRQALERHLHSQPPAQQRKALQGCASLVRLLPELVERGIAPPPSWTLPPAQERHLIFAAVARFLASVAGPTGTLLVLDDLQWAGSDALDLLATLVRSAAPSAETPLLRVVGAYRDTEVQLQDPLFVLLADLAHAQLVTHHTLAPLTAEDVKQLLAGLWEGEDSPVWEGDNGAVVRERVMQRTGGVPFFVVSCAQALQLGTGEECGAGALPWNVAQSVRQRVAALPEVARVVLGMAAVVGRVVPRSLLIGVAALPEEEVQAALDAACRVRLWEEKGAEAYQFAHDVIREVVEADLGAARRTALHRRVAAALEQGPGEPLVAELAYHYTEGGAWEKALDYLVRAGDKAAAAYANQDALDFYARALTVCEKLGDAVLAIAVSVAQRRGLLHYGLGQYAGAAADFEGMRRAAHRLGDRHLEGMALAYRGMSEHWAHNFETAEETYRAAAAVAAEGFDDVRLLVSVQLALLCVHLNRHAEAQPLLRTVEVLAPRVEHPLSQAWWGQLGGLMPHWAGRFDDALAFVARWRSTVEKSHQTVLLLWQRWTEALASASKGQYEQALALLNDVITTADRVGEVLMRARAINAVGWVYGELQNHQRALEINTQGLEAARAIMTANPEIRNNALVNLGDNLLALGRLDEAEEHFQQVEQVARHPRPQERFMAWRYTQRLFHSYGELWLARGDPEKARAYADECLTLAEQSGSQKNVVKGRRLRGQTLLAQRKLAEAEQEIVTALELAQQLGNPPQLWKTLVALGDLRRAQGHSEDARQAYRDALTVIDGVAAALKDESLRETFLTSPHVRHIRELAV